MNNGAEICNTSLQHTPTPLKTAHRHHNDAQPSSKQSRRQYDYNDALSKQSWQYIQPDSVVRVIDSAVREEEHRVLPVAVGANGRVDPYGAFHSVDNQRWNLRNVDPTKVWHRLGKRDTSECMMDIEPLPSRQSLIRITSHLEARIRFQRSNTHSRQALQHMLILLFKTNQ